MRVVISIAANRDLQAIEDYIGQDAPGRAVSFLSELRSRCLALGDAPAAYPVVRPNRRGDVRRRVYGSYIVFDRVAADEVVILRVLHGARDYEALLFPKERP